MAARAAASASAVKRSFLSGPTPGTAVAARRRGATTGGAFQWAAHGVPLNVRTNGRCSSALLTTRAHQHCHTSARKAALAEATNKLHAADNGPATPMSLSCTAAAIAREAQHRVVGIKLQLPHFHRRWLQLCNVGDARHRPFVVLQHRQTGGQAGPCNERASRLPLVDWNRPRIVLHGRPQPRAQELEAVLNFEIVPARGLLCEEVIDDCHRAQREGSTDRRDDTLPTPQQNASSLFHHKRRSRRSTPARARR
mmetsp:Transcript_3098/g.9466  ORF Transcript_3098/g.9466 Transcript_3098/m.9466 type:complete len:253 (-) Transcript_3098:128-886(-)